MGFGITLFAAILATTPAAAFTNGTLVPPYICNPVSDGLPKSFGQLLQFTREKTPTVGFSQNKGQNVQAPQLNQQSQQGNSQIGNSAYILASLHDSPNNINTQQQSLVVQPANGNSIVAGQVNQLKLRTADGSQLKGALLYGQDGTGTRQGSFTDAQNGPFVPFAGCGQNPQGKVSGVIQQTGVSSGSTYNNLVYNAPACVQDNNITIGGLSVTGSGFGIWSYSFTVTGSSCNGGNSNSATANSGINQGTGASTGASNAGATNNSDGAQNGSNNGNSGNTNAQSGTASAGSQGQNSFQGQNGNQQGYQNATQTLATTAAQATGKPHRHRNKHNNRGFENRL